MKKVGAEGRSTELSSSLLRRLLHYDPDTGEFMWLESPRKGWAGKSTKGSPTTGGYLQILVLGHPYRAHRLAWLYMTGVWPIGEIDHRNRDRTDNRWDNLREVCRSAQCRNRGSKVGVSGVRGVTPLSGGGWATQITDLRGHRHRKTFKDFFEAVCHRKSSELKEGYM